MKRPPTKKAKRSIKFNLVMNDGEMARLESLAQLENRTMAGMLRAIINREYQKSFAVKPSPVRRKHAPEE